MPVDRPAMAPSRLAARILAHLPLVAVLILAAALRTWRLGENGFGRTYYAAAVRSQMDSWHNFFFNAFDPGGFVSLDKPPLAIWIQVLSAKLIGFHELAVLLPQVLEGLVAIVIVYVMVAHSFGRGAALIAALLLAVTPGSVAVDRSNNTDSCLIVVLLLAAWIGTWAAETRRLGLFIAAMALTGLAFNVKMGAAIVLVPTLALTYFVARQPAAFARQVAHQAIAAIVLVVVSLAWITIYDLTPADSRPFVGSTRGNSMAELTLLHNGAARFMPPPAEASNPPATQAADNAAQGTALYDNSPTGIARLFRPHQAGQMAWWLPLALAGMISGWRSRSDHDARRSERIQVALWSGWLVGYWLAFSLAGGPFHTYYLAVLAPPLAALAGIGCWRLWSRWNSRAGTLALAALIVTTGAWQSYLAWGQAGVDPAHWTTWLWLAASALAALAAGLLLTATSVPQPWQAGAARGAALAGFAALLVVPVACALSVVLVRPRVAAPAATLAAFEHPPAAPSSAVTARLSANRAKFIAYLQRERGTARFLVAVPNALVAAPLIIATGAPVMAMGGYLGVDPILSPDDLSRRAQSGELRFVMLGGFSLTPRSRTSQQALSQWVRQTGTPVEPLLWRNEAAVGQQSGRAPAGGTRVNLQRPELFDLKPGSR